MWLFAAPTPEYAAAPPAVDPQRFTEETAKTLASRFSGPDMLRAATRGSSTVVSLLLSLSLKAA